MRSKRLLTTALIALGLAVTPAAGSVAVPPDDTIPTLTITDVSFQKFFPADDGYRDTTRVRFSVADAFDTSLEVRVAITDASSGVVDEDTVVGMATDMPGTVTWDGTDGAGVPVGAGAYTVTLTAVDAEGNTSATDARTVTLDAGRLVSRTYRNTISATHSVVERDVRRCGTLKSPVRGWRQSLGYYANARCNASGVPSVAATVNGIHVPTAFKDPQRGAFYRSIVVKTWGGNARQRPGAKALLQYWNHAQESWFASRTMGSRVTSHPGRSTGARPMVVPNGGKPYVLWSLLTANGHWYDVKKFSVVLRYEVMKYPTARPAALGTARVTTDAAIPAPTLR